MKELTKFKIVLADVEQFKKQMKVTKEFVSEINLRINKDDFGFREMTPDNVALIDFKFLSSNCVEYDVPKNFKIGLNVIRLYEVLKVINKDDVVSFSNEPETNKFIIEAKNRNIKRFSIPIIDLDKKDEKIRNLDFRAKVKTDGKQLKNELKALENVADSVIFKCDSDKLVLSCDDDITQLETTIRKDDITSIQHNSSSKIVKSIYGMGYLKKILEGSILSEDVILEFDKNYPLKTTFKEVDKWQLMFILSPRVESE